MCSKTATLRLQLRAGSGLGCAEVELNKISRIQVSEMLPFIRYGLLKAPNLEKSSNGIQPRGRSRKLTVYKWFFLLEDLLGCFGFFDIAVVEGMFSGQSNVPGSMHASHNIVLALNPSRSSCR